RSIGAIAGRICRAGSRASPASRHGRWRREMQVEVSVPSLLSDCIDHQRCFMLEADTLSGALQQMVTRYPLLRLHLYDEQERLRRHVLIFYNEENIAWLDRLDLPLQPGDRIQVLQAVSGG